MQGYSKILPKPSYSRVRQYMNDKRALRSKATIKTLMINLIPNQNNKEKRKQNDCQRDSMMITTTDSSEQGKLSVKELYSSSSVTNKTYKSEAFLQQFLLLFSTWLREILYTDL